MAEDRVLSPLDKKNADERRIILEGPKDPDNFKMPDGRTLTETRDQMLKDHTAEGLAAAETHRARSRELSTQGDPLYNPDFMKIPGADIGGGEEPVKAEGTPASSTPPPPPVATTAPDKAANTTTQAQSEPAK